MSIGLNDVDRRLSNEEQAVVDELKGGKHVVNRVEVSETTLEDGVSYGFEAEYEDLNSGQKVEAFGRVTATGKAVVENRLEY